MSTYFTSERSQHGPHNEISTCHAHNFDGRAHPPRFLPFRNKSPSSVISLGRVCEYVAHRRENNVNSYQVKSFINNLRPARFTKTMTADGCRCNIHCRLCSVCVCLSKYVCRVLCVLVIAVVYVLVHLKLALAPPGMTASKNTPDAPHAAINKNTNSNNKPRHYYEGKNPMHEYINKCIIRIPYIVRCLIAVELLIFFPHIFASY